MARRLKPFERASQELAQARPSADGCRHPPDRLWAWHVPDPYAPTEAIFCVCCCQCGAVLAGAAPAPEEEPT